MAIKPIDHYAIEHGPHHSIYDEEAMTALQLAGRTAAKVNETVRGFNELEASVPGLIADDVNKHIKGGDFDDQIGKHLGNLNERVDNLLSEVVPGGTTRDAELVDIRADENGTIYDTAGAGVRGQIAFASGSAKSVSMVPGDGYFMVDGYDAETGNTRVIMTGRALYVIDPATGKRRTLTKNQILEQLPANAFATTDHVHGDYITFMLPPYQGFLGVKMGTTPTLIMEAGEGDHHFKVPHDVAVLFYFYYGQIDGPAVWSAASKRMHEYTMKTELETLDNLAKGSTYLSAGSTIEFVPYGSNGGVEVKVTGNLRVRFPSLSARHDDWAELLPDTTDFQNMLGEGKELNVMLPRYDNILVYNIGEQKLHIRTSPVNLKADDFILAQVGYGEITAGALLDIKTRMDAAQGGEKETEFTVDGEKVGQFIRADGRKFVFFTDPHLCHGDNWETTAEKWLRPLIKACEASKPKSIICGGDWLTNGDTQENAIYKGRAVTARMSELAKSLESRYATPSYYYNALGNHDTNEQGKADKTAENWTGILPIDAACDAFCFENGGGGDFWAEGGNLEYDESDSVLVLNTWAESDESVHENLPESVGYFLLNTAYDWMNYYVVMHRFYDDDALNVPSWAEGVYQSCVEFNARNAANGKFGRVKAIFCGHRHFDYVQEIDEDRPIPIIMTADYKAGGVPTFDMCVINGSKTELTMYRHGTGEDRVVELAT